MAEVIEALSESVLLRNVSWRTYESFLKDFEDRSVPRIAFDRGILEIMSPTPKHEQWSRLLDHFVGEIAEVWDIETVGFGSATFRRADLESGFEPDCCFYVENADKMIGVAEIDLGRGDLPPDLVIEIEVTNPLLPKLPLYARVGVIEVWQIDKFGRATFHLLNAGAYVKSNVSLAFPRLKPTMVDTLLAASAHSGLVAWRKRVRQWAREQN